jgi:hypothetical protein
MQRKRRYWSEEDTNYLREAYTSGVRCVEIKKHLSNKTYSEVYCRISYLQLNKRGRGSNQPSKIKWTERDIAYIKKNFHSSTNVQIAKALNKHLTVVRNKCRELGLLHMELEYWTDEQVEYLKANYKAKGDSALAAEFNERWHKKKGWSKKHIEKKRRYLHLKRSLEEQFLIRTGRFQAKDYTDFDGKKFVQGKKRLWFANGKYRWMIKIGNMFQPYHRFKWEKLRGPIPKNKKLCFLDGDTTNCSIKNLALFTRAELARRIATKNHSDLTDSYIAGLLSWKDPELKKHIINHPGLIDAKRQQILLNRSMGLSKCKISKPQNKKS